MTTDKTLVERLREAADDYVVGSNIGGLMTEAAALIEELTARVASLERDEKVWRERWHEKCAEVEAAEQRGYRKGLADGYAEGSGVP